MTTNPKRAMRNLLERDRMLTDVLREETARLGLPAIEVDTATTEGNLAERVVDVLELCAASGHDLVSYHPAEYEHQRLGASADAGR